MGAVLDWFGNGFAVLAIVCGALVLFLTAVRIAVISLHLVLRRRGVAEEKRRLGLSLPADDSLPHVVIQIPVFNEGALVERSLAAAARLDWPHDRLHIQVCDDSTDETTGLARAAAQRLVASGIDALVLHRTKRDEFKAGALRAAMAQTPHEYFAIFDVDFVPPADFLRRCMTVLLADPGLAFVQARPDFLNAEENALTRAQAVALDAHHVIDQATRSWAGFPLPFNGTCGIWRRAAVEAAGGWAGETVAEDLDLSYRVWLQGWRGIFLTSVKVPGELPANRNAIAIQQRRWLIGTGQVLMGMLPRVLRMPKLPARGRIGALIHMGSWWFASLLVLMLTAAVIASILKPALLPFFTGAVLLLLILIVGQQFTYYLIANRFLHGRATPFAIFLRDCMMILALVLYLSWVNRDLVWEVLRSRRVVFERTPKQGQGESARTAPFEASRPAE